MLKVGSLGREISCFLQTTAKKLGEQYIVAVVASYTDEQSALRYCEELIINRKDKN